MKKLFIFLFLLSFFYFNIVKAVGLAPTTCLIEAKINGIEYKEEKIPDQYPPTNYSTARVYRVDLDITSIKETDEKEGPPCDDTFIEEAEKLKAILGLEEYNKMPIKTNQKIAAKLKYGGDEFYWGYFLSDIEIKNITKLYSPHIVLTLLVILVAAIILLIIIKSKKHKNNIEPKDINKDA